MKKLDIDIKQEVLVNYANSIVAEFYRFLEKNGIDTNDRRNKYVAAKYRANIICNKEIYGNNDYNSLLEIENELDDLRNMIR